MRPIFATVSPAAFAHNLRVARSLVGAQTQIHAVVKANAYGHGLDRLFPSFAEADGLAVIELDNAVRLRTVHRWPKEIVVLEGFYAAEELALFARHDIGAVVHCEPQLLMLESASLTCPLRVYLKLNSGMNRLGFVLSEARRVFDRVRRCSNVGEIVLATHFARADEPAGYLTQRAAFEEATRGLPGRRSLANSGATAQFGDVGGEIARPGILLYGGSPVEGKSAASYGLRPVMQLQSKVIALQSVRAGQTVGYGGANVAPTDMRIAVVAGGYADGYPRGAKNGTPVLVAGQRAPLFGRVSMDKITVDVSKIPTAQIGSDVQLWGDQVHVDDVAHAAGTISYALLTGVTVRVPIHLQDEPPIGN